MRGLFRIRFRTFILIAMLVASMTLVACAGADGTAGSNGAPGKDGAAGPAGPAGPGGPTKPVGSPTHWPCSLITGVSPMLTADG